jgi:hypothetical protein
MLLFKLKKMITGFNKVMVLIDKKNLFNPEITAERDYCLYIIQSLTDLIEDEHSDVNLYWSVVVLNNFKGKYHEMEQEAE